MAEPETVVEIAADEPAPAADPAVLVIGEEDAAALPATARQRDDGTVEFMPRHPVTLRYRRPGSEEVREERYERFVLRRLSGRDMRQVTAAPKDAVILAAALSAGIPKAKFDPIFDQMDGEDVTDMLEVVSGFLAPGRRTGR